MELDNAMENRRSVRKYKDENVSDDTIKRIIKAGTLAPSAANTQCWHFVVVKNPDLRKKLSTEAGHQDFIGSTPVIIVVCIDKTKVKKGFGERALNTYAVQDTSAAIQNMLLEITELGLATCWIGAFSEEKASEILELNDNLRPVAMLPVGIPAETPEMPPRKDIDEVTEWRN